MGAGCFSRSDDPANDLSAQVAILLFAAGVILVVSSGDNSSVAPIPKGAVALPTSVCGCGGECSKRRQCGHRSGRGLCASSGVWQCGQFSMETVAFSLMIQEQIASYWTGNLQDQVFGIPTDSKVLLASIGLSQTLHEPRCLARGTGVRVFPEFRRRGSIRRRPVARSGD